MTVVLKVVNFNPLLPYFFTDWVKFTIKDFSIVLLSICEFCENLCVESLPFLPIPVFLNLCETAAR